jgi:ankyrin repeat protein
LEARSIPPKSIDFKQALNDVIDGGSALHRIASIQTHYSDGLVFDPKLTPLLIKLGADVNIRGYVNTAPIHCAAISSNLTALLQFLDGGADAHVAEDAGRPSLHFASDVSIAKALIDAGADPQAMDKFGETAEEFILKEWTRPEVHAFLKNARHQAVLDHATSLATPPLRKRL